MATKAVAAAPEAISEESAKTQITDRPTETQAVVRTTHADGTTVGNAPSVAGESQQDREHISPASADNIRSQAVAAAPAPSAPEPEAEKRPEALESNASGSQSLVADTAVSVTLSEPDKVPAVPLWAKFSDLTIDQKFEQARLMDFEARDAYLRERCRDFKMVIDHAASLLNLAAALIESNLPFFLIHFRDMDARGERSDLKGKVMGKTEWLRQNLPDISRGTFYAAYNSVRARYTEQTRLMLGGEVPPAPQRKTRTNELTPIQREVVTALVGQGFKNENAILMVKEAGGEDFDSLFKAALALHAGGGISASPVRDPEIVDPVEGKDKRDHESDESGEQDDKSDSGEQEDVTEASNPAPAPDPTDTSAPSEPANVTTVTHADEDPPVLGDTAADQLREVLANEPDRDVASTVLTEHVQDYLRQFANDRITIRELKVTVEFAGRDHRIMPGDFLEKRGQNVATTLCKCTGVAEFMQRRRVRDWDGRRWEKEHVIFSQHEDDYRVITAACARRIAPEAFPAAATMPMPKTPPEGL